MVQYQAQTLENRDNIDKESRTRTKRPMAHSVTMTMLILTAPDPRGLREKHSPP